MSSWKESSFLSDAGSSKSAPASPVLEAKKSRQDRIWELERELEKKKLAKQRRSEELALRLSSSKGYGESPVLHTRANRNVSKSDDDEEKEINKKGSILRAEEKEKTKKKRLSADTRKVKSSPYLRAFASKIDRKDLKLVRKIGEGSFGIVWEGECFQGPVAIKVRCLHYCCFCFILTLLFINHFLLLTHNIAAQS